MFFWKPDSGASVPVAAFLWSRKCALDFGAMRDSEEWQRCLQPLCRWPGKLGEGLHATPYPSDTVSSVGPGAQSEGLEAWLKAGTHLFSRALPTLTCLACKRWCVAKASGKRALLGIHVTPWGWLGLAESPHFRRS